MCSILYTTENRDYFNLKKLILKQIKRGEHSLWIAGKDARIKWDTQKTIKAVVHEQGATAAIDYIKKYNDEMNKSDSGILIHLRKPSVWDNDISNAHPIKIDKQYLIVQNGTCKLISSFGKVAYKDYDDNRADTYYLGRHLVDSMSKGNLLQALSALKRLSEYSTVGIVFLIDFKKGTVLMYTDWARDCYLEYTDTHVWLISNYPPHESDYEFKATGHILFKLHDWKIVNKNISIIKTKKVTYSASTTTSRVGSRKQHKSYNHKNYYEDPRYSDKQLGLEESTPTNNLNKYNNAIDIYDMSKNKYKKIIKVLDLPRQSVEDLITVCWIHIALRTVKNIKRYCQRKQENKDNIILALSNLESGNKPFNNWGLADIFAEQYSDDLRIKADIRLAENF